MLGARPRSSQRDRLAGIASGRRSVWGYLTACLAQPGPAGGGSVAQQLPERLARLLFAGRGWRGPGPFTVGKLEPLAKVGPVLLSHRLSTAVAALISRLGIVADAVQAHSKVSAAPVAGLTAARCCGARVWAATLVTMATGCHGFIERLSGAPVNLGCRSVLGPAHPRLVGWAVGRDPARRRTMRPDEAVTAVALDTAVFTLATFGPARVLSEVQTVQ